MDNSDSELFYLKWNNFQDNLASGFADFLQQEAMVDVTLAVEGRIVQAHKIILSICSQYFRKMFQLNPCKHPIIILKDVGYEELTDMLDFMYRGEARVKQEDLPSFLKLAETLKIRGLATGQTESNTITKKKLSSTTTKQVEGGSTLENLENKEVVIRKKRKRSGCVLKPLESKSGSHNEKVRVVESSEGEVPEKKQCTLMSDEQLKSEALSDDSFDDENLTRTLKFDTTEDDLLAGPSALEEANEAIPQVTEYVFNLRRVPIWDFYHWDPKLEEVTCKVCLKTLKARKHHGSSILNRHMKRHPDENAIAETLKQQWLTLKKGEHS